MAMHKQSSTFRLSALTALPAFLAGALTACADRDVVIDANPPPPATGSSAVESPPGRSAATGTEPVYALLYVIWNEDGPTGYIALSHSLDVTEESFANAREFPGYVTMQAVEGQLLVASAEEPSVTRYSVGDDLSWTDGDTLSFANFGVPADGVSFFQQYFLDPHVAYAEFGVSSRVVWDPTNLTIEMPKEDSALVLERDGMLLYGNYNRNTFASPNGVIKPFSYHDDMWFEWSADTNLAFYDPQTHAESAVLNVPCPALDTLSRDEDGNTYLSTWEYSTLHALTGSGAAPCVVRLAPDGTLDPTWNPDLGSLTGGRYVKAFRYLGDGKAIGSVLHAEEYGEGFDFSSYLDNVDDFWANEGKYHRFWLFDLPAQTAAPVTGLAFDFVQPSFFQAQLDGRQFIFANPDDTNQSEGTVMHELALDSGTATPLFRVPGDALQWLKLR
jgi:hypothetical protein